MRKSRGRSTAGCQPAVPAPSWRLLPERLESYDLPVRLLKIASETNRAIVQIYLRGTLVIRHFIHVLADSVFLQPAFHPLVPADRKHDHAISALVQAPQKIGSAR